MKFIKKPFIFASLYSFFLLCLSAFILLEAFVIPYELTPRDDGDISELVFATAELIQSEAVESETAVDTEPSDTDITQAESEAPDPVVEIKSISLPDSSELIGEYSDERFTVKLYRAREYDTDIYFADVSLSSAEYFKKAFAKDTFGKNITQKTSTIAENNNAILAVNGDYYGADSSGYVIKNGRVFRSSVRKDSEYDDLVFQTDGSFKVINEKAVSADELIQNGAYQLFAFGPTLVSNSTITVKQGQEVGIAMASNPRTALGMIEPLHYVFLTSDGRTENNEGLSLFELAEFMRSLGCDIAYNLDGGGSATMWFMGEIINYPTTHGYFSERSVSDIVYIG